MNNKVISKHKLSNLLQSLLLIVTLSGILSSVAYLLGGKTMAWFALFASVILYLLNKGASPWVAMKYFRGREIGPSEAPELNHIVKVLSDRAGLERVPKLFYLSGNKIAAFAVGSKDNAAIAVSRGLLNSLTTKETAGVLGHEISHIRNNDMQVMSFAQVVGNITRTLSLIGQALLVFQIPLIIMSEYRINFFALALLIFAPFISGVIQLALSRVREFSADLGSAELLGDPEPLVSALSKIENSNISIFERFFSTVQAKSGSTFLMTHPPIQERVKRLMGMKGNFTLSEVRNQLQPLRGVKPQMVYSSGNVSRYPRPKVVYYRKNGRIFPAVIR
jgi:heat shock protein HtpX